jgi:ornithine carbamoyltransferase
MKKDLLTIQDLNKEDIMALIRRGLELRAKGRNPERTLGGRILGLMFDKASTRTRVSFEAAMFRMGGQTIFLSRGDTQMSRDESIKDTALVLSRYIDILAIRTYSQELIEEMAMWSHIPVINALTDLYHPCQVLSDLMTVMNKKGRLEGLKVAWIGDGNNVANSWINAASILGFELMIASPPGYEPLQELIEGTDTNIRIVNDPRAAAEGADVINTDVWTSMGQEAEKTRRISDFKGFQVDKELVSLGKPDVIVMHCLPAHRGEEIAPEVLEGPNSVVFDQAENKLYLHEALLEETLLKWEQD